MVTKNTGLLYYAVIRYSRYKGLHSRFLIQYAFERHPAQVFRMISGQRRQLFDRQIVIDSDHVPRMDHTIVPETDAAMSPVDRAVFAWTQAVIEYERASLRNSAPQRVLVHLSGFLRRISAVYFDLIADFKRVLDKRKTPARIRCAAKFASSPTNHILCQVPLCIINKTAVPFYFRIRKLKLVFYLILFLVILKRQCSAPFKTVSRISTSNSLSGS